MGLLKKLIEVLKKEYEHYQQLLEIAKNKKEVLIDNNIEKLLEYIKEDRAIIKEVEDLEQERKKIILNIQKEYNIEDKELTYSQMILKFPAQWQGKLSSIRDKLLRIIDEFHAQNEQNRILLEEALKLNKFSLNTILDNIDNDSGTYNNKTERKSAPHLLDERG